MFHVQQNIAQLQHRYQMKEKRLLNLHGVAFLKLRKFEYVRSVLLSFCIRHIQLQVQMSLVDFCEDRNSNHRCCLLRTLYRSFGFFDFGFKFAECRCDSDFFRKWFSLANSKGQEWRSNWFSITMDNWNICAITWGIWLRLWLGNQRCKILWRNTIFTFKEQNAAMFASSLRKRIRVSHKWVYAITVW